MSNGTTEKDPHTLRLEREDRATFDYIKGRCDRLEDYGIVIATPAAGEFTIAYTARKKTRIAALNRAEEIARLLGFEK